MIGTELHQQFDQLVSWAERSPGSLIAVSVGTVIAATMAVEGLRALVVYGRPLWLRNTLLTLSGVAWLSAIITRALRAPLWVSVLCLMVAVVPLSVWLLVRYLTFAGSPIDRLRRPRWLDRGENVASDAMDAVSDVSSMILDIASTLLVVVLLVSFLGWNGMWFGMLVGVLVGVIVARSSVRKRSRRWDSTTGRPGGTPIP